MRERPEIGLGDLATVLGAMGLLDGGSIEAARRVARVLGVAVPAPPERALDEGVSITGRVESTTGSTAGTSTATGVSGAAGATTPGTEAVIGGTALAITLGARPTTAAPALPAPLPAPADDREDEARPPLDPLFSPASSRSLVGAALATWQPDGAIDVAQVVERVATRRPIVDLPRLRRPTIRLGVQVLVDHGPTMEPFARDAAALVAQIRAIAGPYRVEALRFAGDPLVAGPGARRTWRAHRAPAHGVPVVAITDLGIAAPRLGLPSPTAAWRSLAARLDEAGAPLLCIVPYPAARWPTALSRLRIVPWDRSTTVAQVQRLVRSAR